MQEEDCCKDQPINADMAVLKHEENENRPVSWSERNKLLSEILQETSLI